MEGKLNIIKNTGTPNIIIIEFNGTKYKIDTEKLLYVLKYLADEEIKFQSNEYLLHMMEKYELFDEIFLHAVSAD